MDNCIGKVNQEKQELMKQRDSANNSLADQKKQKEVTERKKQRIRNAGQIIAK